MVNKSGIATVSTCYNDAYYHPQVTNKCRDLSLSSESKENILHKASLQFQSDAVAELCLLKVILTVLLLLINEIGIDC